MSETQRIEKRVDDLFWCSELTGEYFCQFVVARELNPYHVACCLIPLLNKMGLPRFRILTLPEKGMCWAFTDVVIIFEHAIPLKYWTSVIRRMKKRKTTHDYLCGFFEPTGDYKKGGVVLPPRDIIQKVRYLIKP